LVNFSPFEWQHGKRKSLDRSPNVSFASSLLLFYIYNISVCLDCPFNILDRVIVTVVSDSSDGINRLPKKKEALHIHSGLINFTSNLALLFHKTGEIIKEDHSSGIDASKKRFQLLLLLEKLLWAYIRTYKQKCEQAGY